MKIVKIMRGLPGSGKSYWSSLFSLEKSTPASICSADKFQMDDGKYNFKPERAGLAHFKCFTQFVNDLEVGYNRIVVDNTNTDPVEIAPYYKMAEFHYYDVEIIWMNTPLEICLARQTHGVPITTMCNMFWNLKKELPRFWKVREIPFEKSNQG